MKCANSPFCQCIYFTSNALARKTEKLAQQSFDRVKLSPSHAYVLMLVLEAPGLQPTMLSEKMLLQPSTITRLLEKLEDRKLVVRVVDGKLTNIYPTPKAKALSPVLEECVQDFYQQYIGIIGKEESEALVRNMGRVVDQL